LHHYRFSLSWPRILPTGYSHIVSKDGLKYYHDLLDELEKNQLSPFVTIYHWDHPEALQKLGGWMNELMVDLFGDYARVVFRQFGSKVKFFTTINEPHAICRDGYKTGSQAPGYRLGATAEYICGHNILKAHARAYHIYNDEFRAEQGGKVGIAIPCQYYFVKSEKDMDARERAFQFNCGRFSHPIFSGKGDYPDIVKQKVAEKSKIEGRNRSKLPVFSEEWIQYI
ncbi:myrosinase 1-like, partial [Copidosoma floridanum]|uniref:myrosinase 1-like n=1 Tax=Copidosoma floridanum TaxID=29053 RepID=UPI0006C9517C